MDELARVRAFRADAPLSLHARRDARARLEHLVAKPRHRPTPRLLVLAAALALLIALGGTAYGLAREFLLGDPAPDPVKEQAAMLNQVRGELIPIARQGPGIRVEETKLGAYLEASTGPVYLWVAPSDRGECWFEQIIGTEMRDGRPNLSSSCGHDPDARPIDWGIGASRVPDGRLLTRISGSVGADVARLELTSDGETVEVPLQGRYFLFEVAGGGQRSVPEIPQLLLTAYDKDGKVVARRARTPFPAGPSGPLHRPQPIDLTGRTPLIEITTRRTGKPIQLYLIEDAPERPGQRCRVLVTPGGTSTGCGGRPTRSNEVSVHPNQIGTRPHGMLLLWGEVGSQIHSLELRFEGGRIEELPLAKQFALYQVDPGDFAPGRRPLVLIGRDSGGAIVGERKLGPWR